MVLGGVALALVSVAPADAATIIRVNKADPDCSDSGPGTAATPLCTIGAGTARARPGDTVSVASGTYAERVTLARSGTSLAPIVVTAADSASVTVNGQINGFDVANRDWITIRGFRVVNTISHGINVTDSSHIVIQGNEVSGAGAPVLDQTARGISIGTTTDSLLLDNRTHDNADAGIFLGAGSIRNVVTQNTSRNNARGYVKAAAGIDVRAASTTVTANVTYDNEDSGINVWDGANGSVVTNNVSYRNGDHGLDIKMSNQVKVVSNTVYSNFATGIEVFNSIGAVLANNIVVDSGVDNPGDSGNLLVDSVSAETISLDYDLLYQSQPAVLVNYAGLEYNSLAVFRAATGKEVHGIQAAPRFTAAASGNLRLSAGSPAIDSANSGAPGQPTSDADGKPRYDDPDTTNTGIGPRTFDDRGAYEFAPK